MRGLSSKIADVPTSSSLETLLGPLAKRTDLKPLAKTDDLNKLSDVSSKEDVSTAVQGLKNELNGIRQTISTTAASKTDLESSLQGLAKESSVQDLSGKQATSSALQSLSEKLDKVAKPSDLHPLDSGISKLSDAMSKVDVTGAVNGLKEELTGMLDTMSSTTAERASKTDIEKIQSALQGLAKEVSVQELAQKDTATSSSLEALSGKMKDLVKPADLAGLAKSSQVEQLPKAQDLGGLSKVSDVRDIATRLDSFAIPKKLSEISYAVKDAATSAEVKKILTALENLATSEQVKQLPEAVWEVEVANNNDVWWHFRHWLDEDRLSRIVTEAIQDLLDNPEEGRNSLPSNSAIQQGSQQQWAKIKAYLHVINKAILDGQSTEGVVTITGKTVFDRIRDALQCVANDVKALTDGAIDYAKIEAGLRTVIRALLNDPAGLPSSTALATIQQTLGHIVTRDQMQQAVRQIPTPDLAPIQQTLTHTVTRDQMQEAIRQLTPRDLAAVTSAVQGIPKAVTKELQGDLQTLKTNSADSMLEVKDLRTFLLYIPAVAFSEAHKNMDVIEQELKSSEDDTTAAEALVDEAR